MRRGEIGVAGLLLVGLCTWIIMEISSVDYEYREDTNTTEIVK